MIGGFSPWFSDEFARRVVHERGERLEGMGNGFCGDFADYRYTVGFLDGMRKALEIAEDIRKEQEQG